MTCELLEKTFIDAMQENQEKGIKNGRVADDWKERDLLGVLDRFQAIARHWVYYEKTKQSEHLAAIACNAMIVFWHNHIKGK